MIYLIIFLTCLSSIVTFGNDKNEENDINTPQVFVDRIISNQVNEQEKKLILERFQISGLALNDLQIKKIFDYAPNIKDVELLEQILEFLSSAARSSVSYDDMQITLSQLVNIYLQENDRILRNIFRYSRLLCCEPAKIVMLEYECLKQSDEYLELLLSSFPEDMTQIIYDLSDGEPLPIEFFSWLCGKLTLNNDLSLAVAKFLYEYNDEHDGLTFLRDEHLEPLRRMMVVSNQKKQCLSIKILSKITHIENEHELLQLLENKKIPSIEKLALEVLSDKTKDIEKRIFASRQLFNITRSDDNRFSILTPYILQILNDKYENIHLKALCYLHAFNLYIPHYNNNSLRKNFIDSVEQLLTDARLHERILCSINEQMLNDPKIWQTVFDIFTNKNMQIESRAFALFALRFSKKNKKYIAIKGIDFLQEISGSDKKRAVNLALWSLQALTKMKSTDIIQLGKAVSEMPDDPPEEVKSNN